jgi:hypothetical protein
MALKMVLVCSADSLPCENDMTTTFTRTVPLEIARGMYGRRDNLPLASHGSTICAGGRSTYRLDDDEAYNRATGGYLRVERLVD